MAHDSHHMIVVGTRQGRHGAGRQPAAARSAAASSSWREGRELALVELPIAGLMSDERAEVVAAKAEAVVAAMRDCGCTLNNAYMQHSLLALVVIPELRISDLGLIDVDRFERTELFLTGVMGWPFAEPGIRPRRGQRHDRGRPRSGRPSRGGRPLCLFCGRLRS